MHWFWRAALAVTAATIPGLIWFHIFGMSLGMSPPRCYSLVARVIGPGGAMWVYYVLPAVLMALVCYMFLNRHLPHQSMFTETRCRKCGYILRGITEPRCPECGERI